VETGDKNIRHDDRELSETGNTIISIVRMLVELAVSVMFLSEGKLI